MKAAFKKEEFGIGLLGERGKGKAGVCVCGLGKGTPLWCLQCRDSAGREVSYNLSAQHVVSWVSTGSVGGAQSAAGLRTKESHTAL